MKFTNNAKLYMELALIKMVDKVEKQEIIIEEEFSELKQEIKNLKSQIYRQLQMLNIWLNY